MIGAPASNPRSPSRPTRMSLGNGGRRAIPKFEPRMPGTTMTCGWPSFTPTRSAFRASRTRSRYSVWPKYAASSCRCSPQANIRSISMSVKPNRSYGVTCCAVVPGRLTRSDYARAALSARPLGDQLADGVYHRPPDSGLAPHPAHMPHRRRLRERHHDDTTRIAIGALGGELGKQRDSRARCDHLPQCLQAGSAEVLALTRADPAAHLQRLIAQAMAFLEEEQGLALQVGNLESLALGQRVPVREGHGEGLREELPRLETLEVHGQRQDAQVDVSGLQLLQH